MSKPRPNPALTTITFVVGLVASAALLRWVAQLGSDTDQTLVHSGDFQIWIGVAAFAVVAFVDTFIAGVRALRSRPPDQGSPSLKAYAGLFVLFAGIVLAALLAGGRGGPKVEVHYWAEIRVGLLLLAVVAAGPWIMSVWAAHGQLGGHRLRIPTLAAVDASAPAGQAEDREEMLCLLLAIRRDIADAVGKLLVLVMVAVLLSGALHAALVPTFISEDDFPASAVLVYGAFFTIMLSLAVLPLMLAWRRTATMLLDQAYPARVVSTADDAAARARLSDVLGINGSLFTSPVALSSLLAPLVTSFLAAFVPQLGK